MDYYRKLRKGGYTMTENLFATSIPIYVVLAIAIGLILITIEIHINTKGVLAVIGGLAVIAGICLCFVAGVPIIEIVFMLLISAIFIIAIMSLKGKNKKIKDVEKIVTDFQDILSGENNHEDGKKSLTITLDDTDENIVIIDGDKTDITAETGVIVSVGSAMGDIVIADVVIITNDINQDNDNININCDKLSDTNSSITTENIEISQNNIIACDARSEVEDVI